MRIHKILNFDRFLAYHKGLRHVATNRHPHLTLTAFQCPPLDEPAHGILRYPTLEYKPNVTVICDPGFRYSLQGSETISCRKNDTWSRTVGKCKGEVPCSMSICATGSTT